MRRPEKYHPPIHAGIHDQGSAPPPGADPLVVLEHQHAVALGSVRTLDDAARSIREKGFTASAFESIAEAGIFLEEFFRKHDGLEEMHLFPVIERVDPAQARVFREEHRTIRSLFAGLLERVREIESGKIHGTSVGDLLRTAGEIVTLLRRHIIHENDILYPLTREKLSAAEIDRLRHSLPAIGF